MVLDFNETCLVNQTLTDEFTDRSSYIAFLEEGKGRADDPEIGDSLSSLSEKVATMSDEAFKRMKDDRKGQKIFTYPPYRIPA